MVVKPSFPAKAVREFIDFAKANPGRAANNKVASALRLWTKMQLHPVGGAIGRPAGYMNAVAFRRSGTMARWLALGALVGTNIGLCLLTPAHAEMVSLVCGQDGRGERLYVSIDAGAGTVASWVTGFTRDQVSPNPASITNDQVIWTVNQVTYTLDRSTGALNQMNPDGRNLPWACTKGSRVF